MVQYNHASGSSKQRSPSHLQQSWKTTSMPTVKLHYEGWVSLPSILRRKLGLNSGDRLDANWSTARSCCGRPPRPKVRGPARTRRSDRLPGRGRARDTDVTETTPARRKPGRPRKNEAADELAAPTAKRPRGRPRWFVRCSPNQCPSVPSTTRPGSCGARRTCSRRGRAWRIPRCRVPILIGPEARWARRRKSAVRFAMSRCASSGRATSTTDLIYTLPSHPPLHLSGRADPRPIVGPWPI